MRKRENIKITAKKEPGEFTACDGDLTGLEFYKWGNKDGRLPVF